MLIYIEALLCCVKVLGLKAMGPSVLEKQIPHRMISVPNVFVSGLYHQS
jgi:hypothetical protein